MNGVAASTLRWFAHPARHLVLVGLFSGSVVVAQATRQAGGADPTPAAAKETEIGIPVTDKLTIQKCGTCHAADDKGNLSRISWSRTTPEGWSQAIKRMVSLNGLRITPEESRSVVRYLATYHGLAPAEAKPVMYMPEHRVIDESNIPNETLRTACASCHGFGQAMSWRRSKTEWKLLQDMHVALYSQADAQYRRPSVEPSDTRPAGGEGGAKPRTSAEVALAWLGDNAKLHTADWAAWRPRIRSPRLTGKWLVSANYPGQGRYLGEMTIAAGPTDDVLTSNVTLRSTTGGAPIVRSGRALLYGGYAWRGRSDGTRRARPDAFGGEARETLWFAPDQQSATGRWFWGDYHEFGVDVTLTRATGAPTVTAVWPTAISAGASDVQLRVSGDSLPMTLTPADIDMGAGVTVKRVVSASPSEAVITIDVAADATSGKRDLNLGGAVLLEALPVHRTVDYIKIMPETGLARLGGIKYVKGFQQFEAIGFEFGPDGKRDTADDLAVGPIEVTWGLDEFTSVFYDDDTKFVGSISQTGLFTPSTEGPNPARRFSRNNYGEVWVTATAKTLKDKFGKALSGRSYLVVTVPSYQRWDQPELGQ